MSDYIDTDDLILARKFLGQSRPSSAASMKALSHRVPIETRLGYWSDLMPNANIFQLDVRKTTDIHLLSSESAAGPHKSYSNNMHGIGQPHTVR
jgi:hypothetical protein